MREVYYAKISEENRVILLFVKFPNTPYLWQSDDMISRKDKVMSLQDSIELLKNEIIIEEKIDGANLGFHLNDQRQLVFQNRGDTINQPYIGQWEQLLDWAKKQNLTSGKLSQKYIYFGEWCYYKHTNYYNKLPDWFIGFDIYDLEKGVFLNVSNRNTLYRNLGISTIREISRGIFTYNELNEFLMEKSIYGDDRIEGLYLRCEKDGILVQRAKIVNEAFQTSMDVHWSRKKKVRNLVQYF